MKRYLFCTFLLLLNFIYCASSVDVDLANNLQHMQIQIKSMLSSIPLLMKFELDTLIIAYSKEESLGSIEINPRFLQLLDCYQNSVLVNDNSLYEYKFWSLYPVLFNDKQIIDESIKDISSVSPSSIKLSCQDFLDQVVIFNKLVAQWSAISGSNSLWYTKAKSLVAVFANTASAAKQLLDKLSFLDIKHALDDAVVAFQNMDSFYLLSSKVQVKYNNIYNNYIKNPLSLSDISCATYTFWKMYIDLIPLYNKVNAINYSNISSDEISYSKQYVSEYTAFNAYAITHTIDKSIYHAFTNMYYKSYASTLSFDETMLEMNQTITDQISNPVYSDVINYDKFSELIKRYKSDVQSSRDNVIVYSLWQLYGQMIQDRLNICNFQIKKPLSQAITHDIVRASDRIMSRYSQFVSLVQNLSTTSLFLVDAQNLQAELYLVNEIAQWIVLQWNIINFYVD